MSKTTICAYITSSSGFISFSSAGKVLYYVLPLFSAPTAAELESTWEAISPRLSQFLCGAEELPDDVIPFDAASAVGVEDQKTQVSPLH